MAFAEDFSVFFDPSGFAGSAILAGVQVQGIYDAPYTVAVQSGPGIAGDLPQYTLPTASVPPDWEGAALVIVHGLGAGSYVVRAHTPDGLGLSVLALELAA